VQLFLFGLETAALYFKMGKKNNSNQSIQSRILKQPFTIKKRKFPFQSDLDNCMALFDPEGLGRESQNPGTR